MTLIAVCLLSHKFVCSINENIQFPLHFFTSSHHLEWQACLLQSSGTRNQTSTSIALGVVHKPWVYPHHTHHSHPTWPLMGLSPSISILTAFPTSKQPSISLAFPHCWTREVIMPRQPLRGTRRTSTIPSFLNSNSEAAALDVILRLKINSINLLAPSLNFLPWTVHLNLKFRVQDLFPVRRLPVVQHANMSPRKTLKKYYAITVGKCTGIFWDEW